MGDDVISPNNWAKMGDSPITPTFHPWVSPISRDSIKGCVSTKIESSISVAVLDSRNPRPYVWWKFDVISVYIITRDILWIDLKLLIRIWHFKPEIRTFIWFHVDPRQACICYIETVDFLIFLSLNIHNCWTCVVFCIYLRITPVLKQPARNNIDHWYMYNHATR